MSNATIIANAPAVASGSAQVGFNLTAKALQTYPNFQANGGSVGGGAETTESSVSYSATPTFNCANSNVFAITLTGNLTSISFSNQVAGQTVNIFFVQDGTGNRTLTAWPSNFKWALSVPGVLSATAGATDLLMATYRGNGNWYCYLENGY